MRGASRRGFDGWLAGQDCDVVGLHEVCCPIEELPLTAFGDYRVIDHAGYPADTGESWLTRRGCR